MKRVLVFGTFDPLHAGHRSFFRQAAALGDELVVVASRDSYIRTMKKREPRTPARERWQALAAEPLISMVMWGDEWPTEDPYRLLRTLSFDVLALGYDQTPAEPVVQDRLAALNKAHVEVVRLEEDPRRP